MFKELYLLFRRKFSTLVNPKPSWDNEELVQHYHELLKRLQRKYEESRYYGPKPLLSRLTLAITLCRIYLGDGIYADFKVNTTNALRFKDASFSGFSIYDDRDITKEESPYREKARNNFHLIINMLKL